MKRLFVLIGLSCCLITQSMAQRLYFPPTSGTTWEQTSADTLGWCTNHLDSLYSYLEDNNSKAFILLKDGRIVFEKYFGTFTVDSNWYWASAGKSMTAFLIGKTQEEGFLNIHDSTSNYLGTGWTHCTPQQEGAITIKHQLSMTTGLDDDVADNHCTTNTCLLYKADAGTRWAYHNAPYTLLEKVITQATGTNINTYTTTRLKQKTGMNGVWFTSGFDNVYGSTPRSFARYGLLAQNNFIWNTDTLLFDTAYVNAMIRPSQTINRSYGYLWWLNGQSNFMIPESQIQFPGWLFPDAPQDMFAALGKNGQIASISKEKGLVWVRMGDAPSQTGDITPVLCNDIWKYLNQMMCTPGTGLSKPEAQQVQVFPNPASDIIHIQTNHAIEQCRMMDITGKVVLSSHSSPLNTHQLPRGYYTLEITTSQGKVTQKIILQ